MSRGGHIHLEARRYTKLAEVSDPENPQGSMMAEREFVVALCGDEGRADYNWVRWAKEGQKPSCPKCAEKAAKQRLKDRPAEAPKLELVKDSEARGGFRSGGGWRVLVDGAFCAYVGFEEHEWRVYCLHHDRDLNKLLCGQPMTEKEGDRARFTLMSRLSSTVFGYRSKEDALLKAGDLRAVGRLPTEAEILAQRAADSAAWAEQNAKLREERIAREAHLALILAGLDSLRQRNDIEPEQRDAVLGALALLTPKKKADEA